MKTTQMKLSSRLMTAFGLLIALTLSLQVFSYTNFSRLTESVGWNEHTYEVLIEVEGMLSALVNIETGERGYALTGRDSSLVHYRTGLQDFDTHWNKAKTLTSDNAVQEERLARLKETKEGWLSNAIDPVIQTRRAVNEGREKIDSVIALVQAGKGKQGMDTMRATLAEIHGAESSLLAKRSAEMKSQEKWTQATTLIGALVALVVGVCMSYWILRSTFRQLGGEPAEAARVANEIARGNLAVEIDATHAKPGSVIAAMRDMRESLARIVNDVRVASESIGTGAGQIASGNSDLSARTEQQAASLEETASSMEELTSTVKQNASNAAQANQLVITASATAERGGQMVGEVVQTMDRINASAHKIVDIIGVIDGIAFQTNILALNAAVESARAGEQGRGFAVVASEVRSLAQRSASAAKEIKALIGDSVQKVEDGTRLVNEAGSTMEEIVSSVKRVADIMAEITAASHEQSSGIEQVNQAVSLMDQATQQNAALVEQAAAASESLHEQAEHLVRIVGAFRLSRSLFNDGLRNAPSGLALAALPKSNSSAPAAGKNAVSVKRPRKEPPKLVSVENDWEQF